MKDYLSKSILDIHQAIIDGEVTPLELLKEALYKAHNDMNNSFEFISDEFAYSELEKLKDKDKNDVLYGIPYAIKDNFSTKDIPTCASSNILKGYIPIYSAEVVERLSKRGAILIGKTTLDEFGMGGHGTSGHLGKVYNPWDPTHKREIGGSSSGSAASVSSGIVPFSIGSDTGDSVRKPASYSSLVGFKPTWGRISRYGLFPFAPSLDHVAFFSRNVMDSAIILEALAGKDTKDLTSSNTKVSHYSKKLKLEVKDRSIAVIKEILDAHPDNYIKKSFLDMLDKLKDKGMTINYVSLNIELCKAISPTYFVLSSAEATSNTANLTGMMFGKSSNKDDYFESVKEVRTKGFSTPIKERLLIGGLSLLKENKENIYIKAQKIRRAIVNQINEILKSDSIILLPASSHIAPLFDEKNESSIENDINENHLTLANFAGLPSITIPLGFFESMPFGINITGKAFDEQNVLNFAAFIESITGIKDLTRGQFDEL